MDPRGLSDETGGADGFEAVSVRMMAGEIEGIPKFIAGDAEKLSGSDAAN
jgi:hypothetical protein